MGRSSFGFNGAPGSVGTDVPTNYVLNGKPLGAGVPSININNVTVNDGTAGNTAVFTVSLSQASTVDRDGQLRDRPTELPTPGTDYKAVSGDADFQPGHCEPDDLGGHQPRYDGQTERNVQRCALRRHERGDRDGQRLRHDRRHDRSAAAVPPVASNISTETLEGTAITLNVLASASDPAGYALSLASFTQPAHGSVAKNSSGLLVYTPAAGYLGSDSFTYTVTDTQGLSATGTVSMLVIAPGTAGNWPAQVFAPYVDMTLYPTYNLVTAMQTAGIKYFTLAFITADSNNRAGVGRLHQYEVNGGAFDQSIRTEISQVRAAGRRRERFVRR